jgi:hypothetical protein
MKKLTMLFILISFFGEPQSLGQINDDLSILPFLKDVTFYIDQIEKDYYKINKLEFDLVSNSVIKSTPVKLYDNQFYKILLFGETGKILDIKLKIKIYVDNKWTIVKEINNPTNILNTDFKPALTDYYEFEITVGRFVSGYSVGRYCLIVSYD